MKKILYVLIICSAIFLQASFCKTREPVIIYNVPRCDVSDDMSLEQYLRNTAEWSIKIRAYVEELINQVTHKTQFIDMRKK